MKKSKTVYGITFTTSVFFKILLLLAVSTCTYFFINTVTRTSNIALVISLLVLLIPLHRERSRASHKAKDLSRSWPEVIDHIVSGIQSGLSLSECVMSLSFRGPAVTQRIFSHISEELMRGESFDIALTHLKKLCQSNEADQLCETLILSRRLGGREVGIVLRLLGEFLRENLALRDEIQAKHGWIKNSAVLAALAPWLLLLILASQPSTRMTYATPHGLLVLVFGAVVTAIAFLWMELVGKIPSQPRLFSDRTSSTDEVFV